MTWTIQGASEGMGPHFDVSNRVREGAGGEGQARAAGSSLLSQPGFHSDASLPSSPLSITYMQSTSLETLGWKKHKLESTLL